MLKRTLSTLLILAFIATLCLPCCADGGSRKVDYDSFDGKHLNDYVWNYSPERTNHDPLYLCNTRKELLEALQLLYLPARYADKYPDSYFNTKSVLLFKGHGSDLGYQWTVPAIEVVDRTLNIALQSKPHGGGAGEMVFYRIYQVTINEKLTDIDGIHVTTTYHYLHKDTVITHTDMAYPFSSFLNYGDVDGNGTIGSDDALVILKNAVGKAPLFGGNATAAEVDGDGNITAADALMILQYVVGKTDFFPAARLKISLGSHRGELGVVAKGQEQWVDNAAVLTTQEELNDYMAQHGLTEDVEDANQAFGHGTHLLVYGFAVLQGETDRMKHQCTVYYWPGKEINLQLQADNTNYHYVKADQADELTTNVHYMYVWISPALFEPQNLFVNATQNTLIIDGPSGLRLDETIIQKQFTFDLH